MLRANPAERIPNLVERNFEVSRPNRVWVSDINYIRTWEGWLYLAIVMDLFSRKIVGWATRSTLHRDRVLDVVMMAVKKPSFIPTRTARTVATTGDDSVEATSWNQA